MTNPVIIQRTLAWMLLAVLFRPALSLLTLISLAGCVGAPQRTPQVPVTREDVGRMLRSRGLVDERSVVQLPDSSEVRMRWERAEAVFKTMDSLRWSRRTPRWCLLCGTPADTSVTVTVWAQDSGTKTSLGSLTLWRTDLPRSLSIDRAVQRGEGSQSEDERWLRAADFLGDEWLHLGRRQVDAPPESPSMILGEVKVDYPMNPEPTDLFGPPGKTFIEQREPGIWRHPPYAGLFTGRPWQEQSFGRESRVLLTPIEGRNGRDSLVIEGWRRAPSLAVGRSMLSGPRWLWRRTLPLQRDTLLCDGAPAERLCVQLERKQPSDPGFRIARLPEGPPWPDGQETCVGVPGQPLDGRLKSDRDYAQAMEALRALVLEDWAGRYHASVRRDRDRESHPFQEGDVWLDSLTYCRLEQLLSRATDAECRNPRPEDRWEGRLQSARLGGECSNCTRCPQEEVPAEESEDWREIIEILQYGEYHPVCAENGIEREKCVGWINSIENSYPEGHPQKYYKWMKTDRIRNTGKRSPNGDSTLRPIPRRRIP